MSRFYSYINSTKEVLNLYKGEEPLSSFLKKYFSRNKKFGSKDRKQISHLCYCYFRLGKMKPDIPLEERIVTGLFLCSDEPNEILKALKPEWNEECNLPLDEKLSIIDDSPRESLRTLSISEIFPWKNELTEGIDHKEFCKSFFVQPDLFLRLRPGKEGLVTEKLEQAEIDFTIVSETCLSLLNSSKIDKIVEIDSEAVIQDYNSQRTGAIIKSEILNLIPVAIGTEISVWDCCAGSGGKSIMAYDINPKIELTVSDIRESILANLKKRFQRAGIKNYKSFIADLTDDRKPITGNYDLIIADVPCSGSGTWSRTPEQLYFFNEKEIEKFPVLQRKIVSEVIPHLQQGGTFIYMTCSVFKKENEDVAMFIKENFDLQLKKMEVLRGYHKKADSMFVAVFEKS